MRTLREISPADVGELHRIDALCFEQDIAYSRRELERYLSMPGRLGAILEEGSRIAGFSLGAVRRSGDALIITLDVHPDFRRRGAGEALLEDLLVRFARAGARRAVLQVDSRNAGAQAFYRKAGFRETARLEDYYGPGLSAIEMTRDRMEALGNEP